MKTIKQTILICCCFILLIGCHKEQTNPTGIEWTNYQRGYRDDDGWHDTPPMIVAHYYQDGWYFDMFFEIIIDSTNRHELSCSDTESEIASFNIPETIIANVPFFNDLVYWWKGADGYQTITFTVTSISDGAFDNCSNLTSVTLPISIREIGRNAFRGCSSLATCTCYALDPPEVYWDSFEGCPLQAIYVPHESVEAYKTADGWQNYASIIYPIE